MKNFTAFFVFVFLFFVGLSQDKNSLDLAKTYCEQGNFSQAQQIYQNILDNDAQNIQAIVGLGKCAINQGDTSLAMQFFYQAMNIEPLNFKPYQAISEFYINSGKFDRAKSLLISYLTQSPDNQEAEILLSNVYLYLNQLDSAQYFFNLALNHTKNPGKIYTLKALTFSNLEQYDSANYYINKAIQLSPADDSLYFWKYKIDFGSGNYQKAASDLDQAISLAPDNVTYYLEKLSIYFVIGDYQTVLRLGEEYCKRFADSNLYFLTGYAMLQLNRLDSAINFITQALSKHPSAQLYYLLGLAYKNKKQFSQAYQAFKKATELSPWHLTYYKEMIYAQLILNSSDLDENLYFKTFHQRNLKRIKKLAFNRKSKYYYPLLYSRFVTRWQSMGLDDYFMLYAGEAFKKGFSAQKRFKTYVQLKRIYERGQIDSLIELGEKSLNIDPCNSGVYYLLSMAYFYKGDLNDFIKNYHKYLGFVLSIMATGNGLSPEKAMISSSTADELVVLDAINYDQLIDTQTLKYGRNYYKVYTIARNGAQLNYFFNADLYIQKK